MKTEPICGAAALRLRPRVIATTILSVLLVAGLAAWSVFGSLSGAVIAQGEIGLESDRLAVQHPDGGVVEEILVDSGQAVRAGAVLVRLDEADLAPEARILEDRLVELRARIARLEAERDGGDEVDFPADLVALAEKVGGAGILDGERELFAARSETERQQEAQMRKREDQVRARIAGLEVQSASLSRQAGLLSEALAIQEDLSAKGVARAGIVREAELAFVEAEGSAGAIEADLAGAREMLAEIGLQILNLGASRRETALSELRDIDVQEAETAERLAAIRARLGRLEIRAPVDGIVHDLRVAGRRAVLSPADPVLFIIPAERSSHLIARIDPRDIDRVMAGQRALLTFPAFSARSLPRVEGEVLRVSPHVMSDARSGARWYEAELRVTAAGLAVLGGRDLVPGMPVEAFFLTREQAPIALMMEPLTRFLSRSMHDG
ncbi:HlyD family type I secretion periplasmic adaptor subunit [Defluviimonas salinarum]|uniref:Membrane fusion protein (MFP) family protein n=1 Tax=Defluviimonas salinarum TaxID=2992147 RepID=A0ABT3J486_9RHOB|nr:HlyD family type I secretion periplasmic adaptor subunit [Defluviimonas salinarum]MCW3782487.1 HlyD family type I secretion periplasmic adaptor subunit [Defluviimonas salinarum]